MSRLKNRQMSIPNGLVFYIPNLKWTPRPQSSLDSLVQQAQAALRGNPQIAKKLGWDLSDQAMTDRIDEFNAEVCLRMGWTDYVAEEGAAAPPPKMSPPQQQQYQQKLAAVVGVVKKLWAGLKSTDDWLDSGMPAVPPAQAEARAAVCATCPLNGKGGLETWFTVPASEAIKRQIEKLGTRKLVTTQDAKLGVCTICLCPLPLLVQTPLQFKLKHMTADTRRGLDPKCWVLAEEKVLKR